MRLYSLELQADINRFRTRIKNDPVGVIDPPDVHHEFVDGDHGRKLDFDKIPTGSDLYITWVSVFARAVRETYEDDLPDVVVGVANGANRVSKDVAHLVFGNSGLGLTTTKFGRTIVLDHESQDVIDERNVNFALVVDDAGTSGFSIGTVARDLVSSGVTRIEAMTTWQRTPALIRLDAMREAGFVFPYSSMIPEPLPTYSPEECFTDPHGFCAQGVQLIEYGSETRP